MTLRLPLSKGVLRALSWVWVWIAAWSPAPAQTTVPGTAITPPAGQNGIVDAGAARSAGQTFDGVQQGFQRLAGAGAGTGNVGGMVTIPPYYPFDAERMAVPTIRGGHLVDYRGGAELHTFNDTMPPGYYKSAVSLGVGCGTHTTPLFDKASGSIGPLTTDCAAIDQRITAAGMNLGDSPMSGPGKPAPLNWLVTHGLAMTVNSSASGITAGIDMFLNKYGTGDVHNYWYVYGMGGFRGGADEMLQGRALHAGEQGGPTFTGRVTGTAAGGWVTTAPLTGAGTQGVGRMLIDTSAPVASGCITAQDTLHDAGGRALEVTVFTVGCGTAVLPATTAWGTLGTAADSVPYVPSSGVNPVTTPTALTVQLSAGAFKAGDLAVFAGDYHETAPVVAAGPAANGAQSVTFALRHTHSPGTVVMQSAFGAGGLEILANDGDGQRYVLDVLGALDATRLAVVAFAGARSTYVGAYNMLLRQFAADTLTNAGGVVTLSLRPEDLRDQAQLQSYPLVTIANAANPAFNGPCMNLRQTGIAQAQCTQASSTGQTSAGGSVVSLGDTGYGNSRFVLWPLAEVLDVQDYTTTPPGVTGTLRLEPHALPLNTGDTVEEPHDYAAGYVASAVGFGFSNVYAAQFSGIEDPGVGGAGVNGLVYARYTKYNNPCWMYAGCGGLLSAPRGYQVGGVAQDFGGMDLAPWPAGQAFTHAGCDPRTFGSAAGGCSNPLYHYAVFRGSGYQYRDLVLDWNPANGVYDVGAPHVTLSQAPLATGKMLYVCARPDTKEIVLKATACDLP